MTLELALVLLLLVGAVVVFVGGLLRPDVAALTILVLVAILGLAPAERVLGGFANPAVLAVAGMYVISAGLSRTGVADWLGDRVVRWAGGSELRLLGAVVLVSGILSGFINNIGVAAMMLPVTMRLARQAEVAPSRLLIPMVLGAQLGGFTTVVGTSANLVASDVLSDAGFEPFGLFAFTPVGGVVLLAGGFLLLLLSPRVLPVRKGGRQGRVRPGLLEDAGFEERIFRLILPPASRLDGVSLGDSLVGSALGVHVLAVERRGERILAPGGETRLREGDRLVVQGRPEFFLELRGRRHLASHGEPAPLRWLELAGQALARVRVPTGDPLVGRTPHELDLHRREGFLVLALRREGFRRRTHVQDTRVQEGDELLLQAPEERLQEAESSGRFPGLERLDAPTAVREFDLDRRLWSVRVTEDSLLAGRRLGETRLGDAIGLMVLAVGRSSPQGEEAVLLPGPDTELQVGDQLLVKTRPEDLLILRGLQRLEVDLDTPVRPEALESTTAGFFDVVLSPRSSLVGKTLRQIGFRRRFGLHVVAVVREGVTRSVHLRDDPLRFGDALVLHGPRRRMRAMAEEPDLIPLEEPADGPPDRRLAPRSLAVLALALGPVLLGWIPVPVGILAGVALMVLTRCLTVEEAYRAVEWPVVVLIAGLLALGAALDETGAAALAGGFLIEAVGAAGPLGLMATLMLASALAAQIMPGPAVVVLFGPVAVAGALQLGVQPQALVLGVAMMATSVSSPLSQPALTLVRGPAGYRTSDYLKLGIPVTILIYVVTLLLASRAFPF
jgi:di/tricarboxylate transporter